MDQSRSDLRTQALQRRRSLAPELRERKSVEIIENLWKCPEITWANEWCVYLGSKDEALTRSLNELQKCLTGWLGIFTLKPYP